MNIDKNIVLPFVEKYRPITLDEIVYHHNIINSLKKYILLHNIPHLLFYGPPGTGKTSTIEAFIKELYGNDNVHYMTMNINASEERGIEVVRNKIKSFVSNKPIYKSNSNLPLYKFVILDEADAMTLDAQAMLKQVIETYTYNARFCLICNCIKKINTAIQSRCTVFKFPPLDYDSIKKKINCISNEYDFKINDNGIKTLCRLSQGDMRKIMHMIQMISINYKSITSKTITSFYKYPPETIIENIYNSLNTADLNSSFKYIKNIINRYSYYLIDILNELTNLIVKYIINNNIDKYKGIFLLSNMRNVNININESGCSDIQIYNLISIYILNRSI